MNSKCIELIGKIRKIKTKELNINASVPDENGNGVALDIGTDGGEEEIVTPEGQNESSGGTAKPGEKEGTGTSGDDGHLLMKPADLRGMSYRFFCANKKERKYVISFTSDFDEEEATPKFFGTGHNSKVDEGEEDYFSMDAKMWAEAVSPEAYDLMHLYTL